MVNEINELKKRLEQYEQNGAAKLYYSLNRKANEMADLLNKHNLGTMEIDDPKDKTFDRLKTVWNDATSLGVAIKGLGEVAGITNDEEKDVNKKPFVDTIAQSRQ